MLIKQISVFLENKMGSLSEVTACLKENGINILALSIADTTDFGILRFIVDCPDKAVSALAACGNAVKLTDVIAITVKHSPGSLYEALSALQSNDIGVEYIYAYAGENSNGATVIIKPSDLERAITILSDVDEVTLIKAKELQK